VSTRKCRKLWFQIQVFVAIGTLTTFQNANKWWIFNFESNCPSQIHLRTFKKELKTLFDSREGKLHCEWISISRYLSLEVARNIFMSIRMRFTPKKSWDKSTLVKLWKSLMISVVELFTEQCSTYTTQKLSDRLYGSFRILPPYALDFIKTPLKQKSFIKTLDLRSKGIQRSFQKILKINEFLKINGIKNWWKF